MDEKRKLGVEMKIKLLMRQREDLAQSIKMLAHWISGHLEVKYMGEIFSENREWLINEGFKIKTYEAHSVEEALECPVVNIITRPITYCKNILGDATNPTDVKEALDFDFFDELDKEEALDESDIDWFTDKTICKKK